ncbi:MAG: molybdate ABC transporter substrate-binding protein [Betaproteobacteria bacterium]|nr:molybdate ABC transporter substrate-binding protein [Betaproteobacteria bacterium]
MKFIRLLLLGCALLFSLAVHAETMTIAAAADLKFAMDDLIHNFKSTHPNDEIKVVYGSSGNFTTQITQGAPYDVFFSADIGFPRKLAQMKMTASPVIPYAMGRIVLWSATRNASKMSLSSLTDPSITRIAIANPKHAPYGQRAEEALRSAGLWDKVEPKLVYGENIAQTAQFVQTGNAQVGIIALSLAVNPQLASQGGYWLIPDSLHSPMEQAYVITSHGAENPLAHQFVAYMNSTPARAIMTQYGFVLPSVATTK